MRPSFSHLTSPGRIVIGGSATPNCILAGSARRIHMTPSCTRSIHSLIGRQDRSKLIGWTRERCGHRYDAELRRVTATDNLELFYPVRLGILVTKGRNNILCAPFSQV
jgi:hypothetical protein